MNIKFKQKINIKTNLNNNIIKLNKINNCIKTKRVHINQKIYSLFRKKITIIIKYKYQIKVNNNSND